MAEERERSLEDENRRKTGKNRRRGGRKRGEEGERERERGKENPAKKNRGRVIRVTRGCYEDSTSPAERIGEVR